MTERSIENTSKKERNQVFDTTNTVSAQVHNEVSEETKNNLQEAFKKVCSELSMEDLVNGMNSQRSSSTIHNNSATVTDLEPKVSQPFAKMVNDIKYAELKRFEQTVKNAEIELMKLRQDISKVRQQIASELAETLEEKRKLNANSRRF